MDLERDKYCLPMGYKINPKEHPVDLTGQIDKATAGDLQQHVYENAKQLAVTNNYKSILDIGCGSGFKLLKYFKNLQTIGIEKEPNYEFLLKKYPDRIWLYADYSIPLNKTINLVICADVLEHVLDPDIIMKYMIGIKANCYILSTPSRELLSDYPERRNGPPFNGGHVREWTTKEFVNYVKKWFGSYEIDYYTYSHVGVTVILTQKNPVQIQDIVEIMGVIYKNFYPKEACSILSWRLVKIARELDLEARMCGLLRPSCDPIQGHSICEVKIDGKWICFDPAFNACLCCPAEEFDDDCFVFYPDYIKKNHRDEFKELFSNITYHY